MTSDPSPTGPEPAGCASTGEPGAGALLLLGVLAIPWRGGTRRR